MHLSKSRCLAQPEETMATKDNKELLELKKQMQALRNSIEDYLDQLEMDGAVDCKEKKNG